MILLTVTTHCSSFHNWKFNFYLHHVGMRSKFSEGYSCFFLFKNKSEGSPQWSVPSGWESLACNDHTPAGDTTFHTYSPIIL